MDLLVFFSPTYILPYKSTDMGHVHQSQSYRIFFSISGVTIQEHVAVTGLSRDALSLTHISAFLSFLLLLL